ncbi:MAG: dihydropteroate synthase [Syntrophaceticus schinkii]|nr:dihydropteroate synthase [Syntrophaceticus schinkii]
MLIIGEKLNSTIPKVRKAIKEKDAAFVQDLAQKQAEAGADLLDVNTAMEDEVNDMQWIVETIQQVVDIPLCIDSTNPKAVEKGLETAQGRVMINSISMEKARLKGILPLALDAKCELVALTTDDNGIPKTVDERLAITGRLVGILEKNNFPLEKLYVDPLVLPLAVSNDNALVFYRSLTEIKQRYGVKTISGLSNVSHSLPQRRLINRYFLANCMNLGMDAAILDPLDAKIMTAITVTNLLTNNDRFSRKFLQAYRAGILEG